MNKSSLLVKITYILVSISHAKCWPFKYWWSVLSSKVCKKIWVRPWWRSYTRVCVCARACVCVCVCVRYMQLLQKCPTYELLWSLIIKFATTRLKKCCILIFTDINVIHFNAVPRSTGALVHALSPCLIVLCRSLLQHMWQFDLDLYYYPQMVTLHDFFDLCNRKKVTRCQIWGSVRGPSSNFFSQCIQYEMVCCRDGS